MKTQHINLLSFGTFCALLLTLALVAVRHWSGPSLVFVAVLAVLSVATIKLYQSIEEEMHDILGGWKLLVALMLGSLLTYSLNTYASINVVLAASTAGVLGVYVPGILKIANSKDYAIPVYCGAFVGMSSALVFPDLYSLFFASALSASLLIISKNTYLGVGGKLGAIAFMGVSITLIVGRLL